jgi:hypothetical protein
MATPDFNLPMLLNRVLHTLYTDRSYDYFILGHDYVIFADPTKLCRIDVCFPVHNITPGNSLRDGEETMTKGPYVTIKIKDRIFEIAIENEFRGPDAIEDAVTFLKEKYGFNHKGVSH